MRLANIMYRRDASLHMYVKLILWCGNMSCGRGPVSLCEEELWAEKNKRLWVKINRESLFLRKASKAMRGSITVDNLVENKLIKERVNGNREDSRRRKHAETKCVTTRVAVFDPGGIHKKEENINKVSCRSAGTIGIR